MMATKRWIWGGVAAVVCLAMLLGSNLGTAADPKPPDEKQAEEALKIVQSIAAAEELIQFGLDNNSPMVSIAGVEALYRIYAFSPPNPDKVKVEGGDLKAKKERFQRLKDLITAARKLDAASSDKGVQAYADKIEDLLKDVPKGTAKGYTCTPLHVKPNSPESLTFHFYGGQNMIINVTKTGNKGVPIKAKVTDPNGNTIAPLGSNALSYNYKVPKYGPYTIVVSIAQGPSACNVNVTTN